MSSHWKHKSAYWAYEHVWGFRKGTLEPLSRAIHSKIPWHTAADSPKIIVCSSGEKFTTKNVIFRNVRIYM